MSMGGLRLSIAGPVGLWAASELAAEALAAALQRLEQAHQLVAHPEQWAQANPGRVMVAVDPPTGMLLTLPPATLLLAVTDDPYHVHLARTRRWVALPSRISDPALAVGLASAQHRLHLSDRQPPPIDRPLTRDEWVLLTALVTHPCPGDAARALDISRSTLYRRLRRLRQRHRVAGFPEALWLAGRCGITPHSP